jgi:DNA-binding transcriptional LysR family regulator
MDSVVVEAEEAEEVEDAGLAGKDGAGTPPSSSSRSRLVVTMAGGGLGVGVATESMATGLSSRARALWALLLWLLEALDKTPGGVDMTCPNNRGGMSQRKEGGDT